MTTQEKVDKLYCLGNNNYTWQDKLLEMIMIRSMEAYNIYQSLNDDEKETVLLSLYDMDNDMGSYGDGLLSTSIDNLNVLLSDCLSLS